MDYSSSGALEDMQSLHLDHVFQLRRICDMWKLIFAKEQCESPESSKAWDQGIDRNVVCHLLFGVCDNQHLLEANNPFWRACVALQEGGAVGHLFATKPT